jgi:hypothetical protein
MCGTIDPGSCIRRVLDFGVKTGYDTWRRGTIPPDDDGGRCPLVAQNEKVGFRSFLAAAKHVS